MARGEGYDVVIVGARCGGAPLAARLAGDGARVLMLDRNPPPADTTSTHFVFPNTVARLAELGALERIEREHTFNPVAHRVSILGNEIQGRFTPIEGFDYALGITRPVLDKTLLEIAIDAGAETRFGEKVTGLIGGEDGDEPVTGVVLEGGERIDARWVIGADGRASVVAGSLGLEKQRPLREEMSFLFAYWRGDLRNDCMHIEAETERILTWGPNEDDVHMLATAGRATYTHGNAEQRLERYLSDLRAFSETLGPDWEDRVELASDVRVAPEPMMRGYFRRASGPGWALVGDAGHFKHPATAQGISDAIEQALHVAEGLNGADPELEGYEAWRDSRAAEHYEWSYNFARFPEPEKAGPLFGGLASDPEAGQEFRDVSSRLVEPRSGVFTNERLARWFADAAAPA